jgi:hypothetical protein
MREALTALGAGRAPAHGVAFEDLCELVGFDAYDAASRRY